MGTLLIRVKDIFRRICKIPLVKDASTYTIINILEKGIPFLILPIISRIINQEEMGVWMLFQSIYLVLLPLLSFNLNQTVLINYYQLSELELKNYLKQLYFYGSVLFVCSLLLVGLFGDLWADFIGFSKYWQILFCVTVFFEQIFTLYVNLLRMEKHPVSYGKLIISYTLFQNVLSLFLVMALNLGWMGLIYGKMFSLLVFFYICIVCLKKKSLLGFSFHVDEFVLKDVWKISFPSMLHQLGTWAANSANRLLINFIIGKAATGSYGIAASFSLIVGVLQDALNKAYVPFLYEILPSYQDKASKARLVNIGKLYYVIIILLSIFFASVGYFSIGMLFGPDYANIRSLVIPLVLAVTFSGLYKIHVNYIFFSKKVIKITIVTFTTGALNCLLSWFMIKEYGVYGAAYSFLIVNIITYIWIFGIANKMYPLNWFSFTKNDKNVFLGGKNNKMF